MIGDGKIVGNLRAVACKLTRDQELQKDLMQEMFVHLVQVRTRTPNQTESWYIKSCEFHARNVMKLGRSIDSLKRARNGVPLTHTLSDSGNDHESSVTAVDPVDLEGELMTKDIVNLLLPHLSNTQKEILFLLMKGFGVRETGRRLGISHPAVIKHRRKIARIARDLLDESMSVVQVGESLHETMSFA